MKASSPGDSPGVSAGRVFIVDDDPEIRYILKKLLAPSGYRVEEFELAEPGIERIREEPPDVVLLDLQLPDRSGHDVLERIRSDSATRWLPVVVITGHGSKEDKIRATREGATDFLTKPFVPEEVLPRVRSLVLMKQFSDEHEHAERVIRTLAKMVDARDPHTAGHSGRVAEYADRIAERIGLEAGTRLEMRRGALFLDLGKIVIPDHILHKPGVLTPEERHVIEQHPTVGYELLSPMRTMSKALPIVYSHHEKLDGSGYPQGLSESDIPTAVRIVTVADIFDALMSDRAQRPALKLEIAYEILQEGVRKGWWDAEIVAVLREVVSEAGMIAAQAAASP